LPWARLTKAQHPRNRFVAVNKLGRVNMDRANVCITNVMDRAVTMKS
jgi:hypothetical protein